MLRRGILDDVRRNLADYPAVAIVGPRQCGKTTLAASLGGSYFDLENEADRLRLDLEWTNLAAGKKLIVLDEAHAASSVFPRIRGAIDQDRKRNGRFLILGSVSPYLMTQVSESLAGRISILELTPLLLPELKTQAQRNRHWLCGGYPDGGVLTPKSFPRWQKNYLASLTQRDLPAWGLPARPQVTERFAYMLAALHGQPWNASKVAQGLGINYQTVNSYLAYLDGAFLIRRLPPYQANIHKRLVKAPKVQWRDTGLLHSILGVASRESLLKQPWVGASWESYVIEQILGTLAATGRTFAAYYFRTSDQFELDLVLEVEAKLWAFEVKLTTAPSTDDMARLNKVADMIDASRRVLVSKTASPAGDDNTLSTNLESLLGQIIKWT
ncbi:MAG: ATP-binding protein [Planctomycetes bacterium]|nr:ATP-binding protein [Planctomycetota bacterium]